MIYYIVIIIFILQYFIIAMQILKLRPIILIIDSSIGKFL